MDANTICSDFGAQKIKFDTVSTVSPSISHEVMGPDAMILVFWMLSFKPTFSLSSYTFIKRLFSSSSLSAIRVVSSAYLRLLIFLPVIWTSLLAQTVKRLSTMRETGFDPWVRMIPWRRKWQSTPVLLPGKSHGQRSLLGNSSWGHKELDMTEWLHFTSLQSWFQLVLLPAQHFSWCTQQIWKTQQWSQVWKRWVFIPIPKKGNARECSNNHTIALISNAGKIMLKILQARLQQYVT